MVNPTIAQLYKNFISDNTASYVFKTWFDANLMVEIPIEQLEAWSP
jgi:hypothetical protein